MWLNPDWWQVLLSMPTGWSGDLSIDVTSLWTDIQAEKS